MSHLRLAVRCLLACPLSPPPSSSLPGDFITNSSTAKRTRVPRLVRIHSDELEDIPSAVSRNPFLNPQPQILTTVCGGEGGQGAALASPCVRLCVVLCVGRGGEKGEVGTAIDAIARAAHPACSQPCM